VINSTSPDEAYLGTVAHSEATKRLVAGPTGFTRADAISIRVPIEGAERIGEATA
jgi:hypothetical protein